MLVPLGVLSLGAIFAGLTAVGITGYGVRTATGGPRLDRVRIPIARLPRSMDGLRIATVSEYSRLDISTSYGIDRSKIDVVYNGVNEFFKPLDDWGREQARKKFAYGKPYFLCVGSLHPRKNIVRLVEAFGLFKKENASDVKLVFAGQGMWGLKPIQKAVEKCEARNDIIFTERLSNEDLAAVTASALALTYVPYYEGFGIPVIEAMACGVPVVASQLDGGKEALRGGMLGTLVDFESAAGVCEHDPSNTGKMRCLSILVSSGGAIKMCDPKVGDATDPRHCS